MSSIKLFKDADGILYEVAKIENGRVHVHVQGGGFEFTAPAEVFAADFTPAELTWKRVRITGDWCDPDEAYEAWWDGRRWNGWVAPYVTYDEVLRMFGGSSSNLKWCIVDNQVIWSAAQGDDEADDEADTFTPEQIDCEPQTVYRMAGWCWELAEELAEEQP